MTQTDSAKNTKDIRILTGNHAAAHAFRQARVGVVSAYPITPQSPVVEKISEFINEGQLKARFLMVESEHSAAAACCAASATGSRVGTATSAHGLMLMYEMLPWASGTRLPIVINLATRSCGAPWSVWDDHSDFITVRDVGWIQFMCEDNQEIYDTNFQAFKIAEDPRVYIPTIEREEGTAPGYYEFRYSLQKALENSIDVILEVHDDYAKKFGRSYGNGLFKTYKTEDADTVIFAMGSVSSQVKTVIGKLREEGLKIGLVSLRLFRPFPVKYLREFFKDKKNIIVFDREIGYGYEGVLAYELKAALYGLKDCPFIKGFIVGLGGRDVKNEHIIDGVHRALEQSKKGEIIYETEFLGLKLDELDFLK